MVKTRTALGLTLLAAIGAAQVALAQPPKETKPGATPATPATGQPGKDKDAKQPAAPPGDDMEKAWKDAGTPGENQARLKAFAGEWEALVKEMGEDGKSKDSKATVRNTMAMGGRYLRTKVDGTWNGEAFDGAGVIGYNNLSKQYESTWIDSASTGVAFSTGTCDSDGKTFTFIGEMIDPVSKKKMKTREVWHLVSPTKYTIQSFGTGPDGKEAMMMDISLSRTGEAKEEGGKGKGKEKDKDDEKGKGKKDEKKSGS